MTLPSIKEFCATQRANVWAPAEKVGAIRGLNYSDDIHAAGYLRVQAVPSSGNLPNGKDRWKAMHSWCNARFGADGQYTWTGSDFHFHPDDHQTVRDFIARWVWNLHEMIGDQRRYGWAAKYSDKHSVKHADPELRAEFVAHINQLGADPPLGALTRTRYGFIGLRTEKQVVLAKLMGHDVHDLSTFDFSPFDDNLAG